MSRVLNALARASRAVAWSALMLADRAVCKWPNVTAGEDER